MKRYKKKDYPVEDIRHFLEPGPTVLVSSAYKGKRNIMTMGWQTTMEFSPSLIGCVISEVNHSFEMIRKSRECVINLPTVDLAKTVARIGNCSGDKTDKFEKFGLTVVEADRVKAPLIAECVANFECRLQDARLVKKYNFFIFEVLKAHVAPGVKYPRTIHYHGRGVFTVAGRQINLRRLFTKWPS